MTDQELIKPPFDEEFDTMMEVQRNPTGAWMAIQEQANRIDELEKRCSLYARTDRLFVEEINDLEAKLAKAMESIKQSIKLWEKPDGGDRGYKLDNAYDGFELLCKALAELEGEDD